MTLDFAQGITLNITLNVLQDKTACPAKSLGSVTL